MAKSAIMSVKIISDAQKAVSGINKAAGAVTGLVKAAGAAAVAYAGYKIAEFGGKAVKMAGDLEQSVGAIDTVFKGSASQMHDWAKSAALDVGLTQNEFNELGTLIGTQLKNGGTAMDQLAPKTNELIGLGSDLASMFGGTSKDAVEALSSALKGERDPIEKYGVSLNQARIDAKAAELGFTKVGGALSAEANQAATLALIMEQTADAHGNFAKEANTFAGQQQRMSAQWDNIAASVGGLFLPALTTAFAFINASVLPGIQSFADMLGEGGLSGAFTNLGGVISQWISGGGIQAAFMGFATVRDQVLTSIIQSLPQILTAIATMVPTMLDSGVTLFMSLAQAILTTLPAIISTLVAILPPILNMLVGMLPQLLATGVTLFSSLATAIMGALPGIITTLIGILPSILGTILGMLPQLLIAGVNLFIQLATAVLQALPQILSALIGILPELVSTIVSMAPTLLAAGVNAFVMLVQALGDILPDLLGQMGVVGSELIGAVIGLVPDLLSAGIDLGQGLIDGIMSMGGAIIDAIGGVVGGAIDFAKGLLGIHSPSRVFREIGENTGEGMALGILAQSRSVQKAADKLVPTVKSSAYEAEMKLSGSRRQGGTPGSGGRNVTIKVEFSGLVTDKVGVAREIRRILEDEERLVGGAV